MYRVENSLDLSGYCISIAGRLGMYFECRIWEGQSTLARPTITRASACGVERCIAILGMS